MHWLPSSDLLGFGKANGDSEGREVGRWVSGMADRHAYIPEETLAKLQSGPKDVTYKWSMLHGNPSVEMKDEDKQQLKLENLQVGEYEFRVTIKDADGKDLAEGNTTVTCCILHAGTCSNQDGKWVIFVEDLEMTLPANHAFLKAVIPEDILEKFELKSTDLKYNWSLVSNKKPVQMKYASSKELSLELDAGVYEFKIVVTGTNFEAEGTAKVTVKDPLPGNYLIRVLYL